MKKYNYQKIEKRWQKKWDKNGIYEAEDFSKKPKYYCLIEFPYPSGAGLHVGHLRSHIAIDIVARKKRMSGFNVIYPIGWDAFGLPTENFAIKTKTHPKIVTENNIKNFTKQIKSYGPSFDWSREINTTDPKYYKWTQWIFLKLFNSFYDEKLDRARPIEKLKIPKNINDNEKRKYIDDNRIAYEKEMAINWCPSCKIGLANEEVVNGACERCGAEAEKKTMKQWMLRITKYAERLIRDLDTVDYLNKIKTQQVNWIGRSEGALIKFSISEKDKTKPDFVEVFTTRPDTLFGCTYMVLAPEHPLITNYELRITNYTEVEKYIEETKNKSDLDRTDLAKEKTGVEMKGIKAINPANNEEVPIWIADYVLASYGTGAIMAVPAHDQRDFEFAKKFNLPINQVIAPLFVGEGKNKIRKDKKNTKREVVDVIIKHWEKDEYFCLDWNKSNNNWKTFITGGVEEGENAEKAAIREAKEESGYQNMRVVRKIGNEIHSRFFAAHKDVNRYDVKRNCIYIELLDDSFIDPKKEETKNHNGVWIKKEKVKDFINLQELKIHWNIFQNGEKSSSDDGVLINSGKFTGIDSTNAQKQITKWLEKNKLGKKATNYKLRDWIFSRQHYWGEPIPVVKCEKCGNVPLSEKDLPLELPDVKNYEPTDTGESPLANISKWVNVKCPKCSGNAKRETDTMPNWAGSSWYFLRYLDSKNNKEFASRKKIDYWMPVDLYNGGMEHTTLHLLYSRFWHKFLFDLDYVQTTEPYKMRRSHGMVLDEDGQKMSKSRGNVINPDDIIKQYGADTLRLYEMFMGPYGDAIPWNTSSLIGMNRFLERVWKMQKKVEMQTPSNLLHSDISQVKLLSVDKLSHPNKESWKAENIILIATNNQGKLKELRDHLKNFNIISLKDIDKKIEEPEENGKTFEDNSLIKAKYYAEKTGYLTIADDSGLCINALNGRPGVFSNRYAEGDYKKAHQKLFKELENKKDRSAYFQSTITLYNPKNNRYDQFNGRCEGKISNESCGDGGFGYDPIFIPNGIDKTFGECLIEEKSIYSHRKKAIDKLIEYLEGKPSSILSQKNKNAIKNSAIEQLIHKTIKKVTEDIDNLKFNTAISSLMILLNGMEKEKEISLIHYSKFLILLSPFAPHITEELWEIKEKDSIHLQLWPKFDPKLVEEKEITMVIQINGKLRDQVKVPADISEEDAKKLALESEKIQKWVEGKEIRKVIFIKGRLVNIVV